MCRSAGHTHLLLPTFRCKPHIYVDKKMTGIVTVTSVFLPIQPTDVIQKLIAENQDISANLRIVWLNGPSFLTLTRKSFCQLIKTSHYLYLLHPRFIRIKKGSGIRKFQ